MGRAPMIPGFLGSNIEGVIKPERRAAVHGNWDQLPSAGKALDKTPEEIFAGWEAVRDRVGSAAMAHIPFDAVSFGLSGLWAD